MDKIFIGIAGLLLAVGALFASTPAQAGGLKLSSSPNGIRNNNPFNLKYFGIGWVGETGFAVNPKDGAKFSKFDTAENGIRAGMRNIKTKFVRDNANTISRLIPILSPSFENPTATFIDFVSRRLNVSPEQTLDFERDIIPLSKAIVFFENGQDPYSDSTYRAAKRRV